MAGIDQSYIFFYPSASGVGRVGLLSGGVTRPNKNVAATRCRKQRAANGADSKPSRSLPGPTQLRPADGECGRKKGWDGWHELKLGAERSDEKVRSTLKSR